jgi:dihydroorotate dehydrogenase electron transfer subunit
MKNQLRAHAPPGRRPEAVFGCRSAAQTVKKRAFIMFFQEIPVKKIEPITSVVFRVSFISKEIAREARPGQFVMIHPQKFSEPLLPRPFSIHRVEGNRVELLIRAVGQGTRQLHGLSPGEVLEIKGPLGRGFALDSERDPILVAGGIGVAPLLYLADRLTKMKRNKTVASPRLLIGAGSKKELWGLRQFKEMGIRVQAVTEDGSFGRKGLVSDLLAGMSAKGLERAMIYTCGPKGMLRAVASWAASRKVLCQVSLEAHMACGMGACLGCSVARTAAGGLTYSKVCQDGPVFEAQEVDWDA